MNKTFLFLKLSALAFSLATFSQPAMGKIVNLADQDFDYTGTDPSVGQTIGQNTFTTNPGASNEFTWHAGVINGAVFRRAEASDDLNSGSGVFRDLYSSQDSPIEQGYNRPKQDLETGADLDSSVLGGSSHLLTVGDLQTDSSGLFYIFTVDANEKNNAVERFISLDKFRLYVENDTSGPYGQDPTTLPGSEAALGDLSNLGVDKVYDMDQGVHGDSTVLMDYSTSNGSGTFDTFVFIPKTVFDDYDDAAYVYLYTQFGAFDDSSTSFIADAGGEQIAAYTNFNGDNTPPVFELPPSIVPEPHSAMLASMGALMLAFRRRRS